MYQFYQKEALSWEFRKIFQNFYEIFQIFNKKCVKECFRVHFLNICVQVGVTVGKASSFILVCMSQLSYKKTNINLIAILESW